MSAASTTRRPVRPLDRVALAAGLALVSWSQSRIARRALRASAGSTRRRTATAVDIERLDALRGSQRGFDGPVSMTRFR